MKQPWIIEPFDSALLGMTVGRLQIEGQDAGDLFAKSDVFFKEQGAQILFCQAPLGAYYGLLLKNNGYYSVSVQTAYHLSVNAHKQNTGDSLVSITDHYVYRKDDKYLVAISQDLALVSHYGKDPFISREGAFALYKEWVKNTYSGYAKKVFTALDKKKNVLGFLSLKEKASNFSIDLLGVHTEARNKGVASLLLGEALRYVFEREKSLYVTTQAENIPASRFYQKNGFLVESVSLISHKIMNGE